MSVIHTRTSVGRYEAFQTFTQKVRKQTSCLVSLVKEKLVKEKIEDSKHADHSVLSNRKRPSTIDLHEVEQKQKKYKSEIMHLIPASPCEASVEEAEIETDPFFSDEESSDEELVEMHTQAYEVDCAVQYTQLLHQIEENKGKIIKTKGSDILIQKPHRLFSTSEENVKGSSSKGFQKLLNEAERRMEKEPLTALQMLRTMSFNPWVKRCLRHHTELKNQFEQLHHRVLMRTLEEPIYYFTKLIGSVYRRELQASLEIGDKENKDDLLKEKCPNLSAYVKMFDTFRDVIADKILSQSTAKQRRDVIETFIYVAHSALMINRDYTTAMLILNGLNAQSVTEGRLKETWQMLPKSTMKKFRVLDTELRLGMRSAFYVQNVKDMLEVGTRVHSVPFLVPFQAILKRSYLEAKQAQDRVNELETDLKKVEELFSMKEKGQLATYWMELRSQIVECGESEIIKTQQLKAQCQLVQEIERAPMGIRIEELKIWQNLQSDLKQYQESIKPLEQQAETAFEHLLAVTYRAGRDFDQLFSSHEPSAPVFWFNQPSAFSDEEKAYQRSLEIEPLKIKQPHKLTKY